jgi:hypothetical protein
MAYTITTSQREMKRVAGLAYEGKRIRVSLASVGVSGYTSESTTANWDSVKTSGGGYADVTFVAATGAYDGTDTRYEVGDTGGAAYDCVFTATGGGFTYDRVYVVVGDADGDPEETYISFLGVESPAITLAAGQSRTYPIQLCTDD